MPTTVLKGLRLGKCEELEERLLILVMKVELLQCDLRRKEQVA
jgi:hypothetical protein